MTQRESILSLLRQAPDRKVSVREFNANFLFHKLATRCSELRKDNYDIRYIPSETESPLDAAYQLISEPEVGSGGWSPNITNKAGVASLEAIRRPIGASLAPVPSSPKFEEENGQFFFA